MRKQLSKLQQFSVPLAPTRRSYSVSPDVMLPGSSANLAAIVGLPRVSFLIVRSTALSLASRKLLADLCSASLVFSRSLIASSMRLMASSKPSEARRQLRPNAVLNSSS